MRGAVVCEDLFKEYKFNKVRVNLNTGGSVQVLKMLVAVDWSPILVLVVCSGKRHTSSL